MRGRRPSSLPVHGRCRRRSTTDVSASVAAANITDERPAASALRTTQTPVSAPRGSSGARTRTRGTRGSPRGPPVGRQESQRAQNLRGHQHSAANGAPAANGLRASGAHAARRGRRQAPDSRQCSSTGQARGRGHLLPRSPESSTIPPMPSVVVGSAPPPPPRLVSRSNSMARLSRERCARPTPPRGSGPVRLTGRKTHAGVRGGCASEG